MSCVHILHIWTRHVMRMTVSPVTYMKYSQSYLGWHFGMPLQSSKLKARTSLFTETWQKRPSSFELWAFENDTPSGIGCNMTLSCHVFISYTYEQDMACVWLWVLSHIKKVFIDIATSMSEWSTADSSANTAPHYPTLQHTATHCTILPYTAATDPLCWAPPPPLPPPLL